MRGTYRVVQILTASLTAALIIMFAGCGGGSSHTSTSGGGGTQPISVSITQGATASVNDGATLSLGATVLNDSANAGVTWSVTGTGTLANSSTTGVTYIAPATGTGTDTVTATSVTDSTKSASITISYSPAAIAVTITQGATATVTDGLTLALTATVANDSTNAGVTWTVTGTGTLSNKTITSATYDAPATGTGTDTVTATSVTDTSKSATIHITYNPPPPISVTITGKFSQIQTGTAQVTLSATVQNDAVNAGVTWTLTSGGTACSPGCGTLSGNTATTVVYTPPATVPATPTATITATSVTDPTKSDTDAFTITSTAVNACGSAPTGNESLLHGQYAFLLRGFEGSGAGTPVIYAASFTADGTGKVTAGEFDFNNTTTHQHLTVNTASSSYTVGLDPTGAANLGCLTLSSTGGTPTTFHFVLGGVSGGVASKGRIIEFDDSLGTGTRGAGPLLLQDSTSFSLSKLQPNYAFGVDGWDLNSSQWEHFAMGGSFTISTGGSISSGYADVDNGGNLTSAITGGSGSIGTISATSGRATGTQIIGSNLFSIAVYMVSANEFFIVSTSPVSTGPVFGGRAIVTGNSFSNASLSGGYIISVNGASGGFADCALGLFNLNSGSISGTLNEFDGADVAAGVQSTTLSGAYSVAAASGRVTLTGVGSNAPVIYLATPTDGVAGFVVGTDGSATFGTVDPQPSATYSVSSISGAHFYGTQEMNDNTVQNEIGVVSISSTGVVTGTSQDSDQSGLTTNGTASGTVTVNADGTGNVGTGTFFVTNGTDFYFLNGSDAEVYAGAK
jgi:hypothetical protein